MGRNGKVSSHVCPYVLQGYRHCRCDEQPLYEFRRHSTAAFFVRDAADLVGVVGAFRQAMRRS